MNKVFFQISIIFIIGFTFFACKKNSTSTITPTQAPYKLVTPYYFGNRFNIPDNNPLTNDGIELGRMLFYEKMLSSDNSISCSSCHQQQLAFTDGLSFSNGVNGQKSKRSSMSLVNLLWVDKYFWDGRVNNLEDQAKFPIEEHSEMNLTLAEVVNKLQKSESYPSKFKLSFGSDIITTDNVVKALSQFERTLISSNSKYDKYLRSEYKPTSQELNGIVLFQTHPVPENNLRGGNCGDCHGTGALTTTNTFHNNGLEIEPIDKGLELITGNASDRGKMRVPSLRNIALTAPYMHDGRFKTLEEVLDHYNDHIQNGPYLDVLITAASNETNGKTLKITEKEKADIIGFLNMLTDSTFIHNKNFSDPSLK